MKNNQKGITLIALVVTIIVLLILAGVSIAMLSGENGILTKASQADAENQLGAANDAVSLYVTEQIANFYEEAYVNKNTTTLSAGLDAYLLNTVTVANLEDAIDNKDAEAASLIGVAVNTDAEDPNPATQITSIVLTISDNQFTYTSTGTVTNGKVVWKITKAQ